jgi:1-acyl-sn-glycerol-3-phosphate acyltransferase
MGNFVNLFKNKNFSRLWWGQFISSLGDRFTQMALLTIAMILYADNGEKMAWITFWSLLPFLIFGQIFGVLADKLNRKKLMVAADVLRALLVAAIPFISRYANSLSSIYLVIFCVGTLSALFFPAKMAIIPNLLKKDKFISANSLIASTGMFSTLIGTLVAGYLIKFFGPNPMFFINSFTFMFSALMISSVFIPPKNTIEVCVPRSFSLSAILKETRAGLSFIKRHRLVLRMVQLNMVFSLVSAFFYINLLNYSRVQLKVFSQGYGILLACLGLGLCFGAFFLGKRIGKLNYNNVLFIGFGIISATSVFFMFRPNFAFSVLFLLIGGCGAALVMITLDSLLQRVTPDALRANVFGARGVVTNFIFLLSLIAVGKLIAKFNYFYIFGFIWLVSFITTLIIYISEGEVGYRILRLAVRLILRLFFDLKVSGLENLPPHGKVILAGNHTSLMDGVIIVAAYPRKIYFLATESVFKANFIGRLVRHFGFIPVKKDALNKEAIKEAIRILENRNTIGIFPEGKISQDGKLTEGKRGVALLALKTGAAIIPFAIEGAYQAWPLAEKYPKRHPIEIRFAQTLDISEYETSDELANEVMQEIEKVKKDMQEDGLLNVDPNIIIRHIINFG